MISWSKDVVKESVLNAAKSDKDDIGAIAANMSEIVKNAVLLDNTVSMYSSKRKMPGNAFMHSIYAVAKIDNRQVLVKLFAEEALPNKGGEPFMRAYTLKYIEKVAEFDDGVHSENGGLTESHSTTINSISDLFALVKQHDPGFNPREVNPALINEDGTPKIFHHGTRKGGFTTFRDWSYWTENEGYARRYADRETGETIYNAYLTADKIFDPSVRSLKRVLPGLAFIICSRTSRCGWMLCIPTAGTASSSAIRW